MQDKKAPAASRVAAAQALLDRGWGKAPQDLHHSGADGGEIIFKTVYESRGD